MKWVPVAINIGLLFLVASEGPEAGRTKRGPWRIYGRMSESAEIADRSTGTKLHHYPGKTRAHGTVN